MEKSVKLIGEIDFKDTKVQVYNDPYAEDGRVECSWRMRNPGSFYQGIMFMNLETGEMTYPEDAVIPEQTDRDREMLPQFIITGCDKIDDKFISSVGTYLENKYLRMNQKYVHKQ